MSHTSTDMENTIPSDSMTMRRHDFLFAGLRLRYNLEISEMETRFMSMGVGPGHHDLYLSDARQFDDACGFKALSNCIGLSSI